MNGSTSRACLYWINALIITLGILVVGFASYALADPQNIETFLTVALPKATFIYSLIFALSLVFISGLGVCGSKTDSKLGLGLYIFIVFAALCAQLAAFIIVLGKYGVIQNAKLDKATAEVQTLEKDFVAKCIAEPNDWKLVQNAVVCCGYDARATYEQGNAGGTDWAPKLNTGDECAKVPQFALTTALARAATSGDWKAANKEINTAYQANKGNGDYFCKATLVSEAEKYSLPVGVTAGILALLQLVGLVSASRLACCVSVKDGGYMEEWRPSTKEQDEYSGVAIAGTGRPITETV